MSKTLSTDPNAQRVSTGNSEVVNECDSQSVFAVRSVVARDPQKRIGEFVEEGARNGRGWSRR